MTMVRTGEIGVLRLLYTCSAHAKTLSARPKHTFPSSTQPSQLKRGLMPPLKSVAVTPFFLRHHKSYAYPDRPLRSSTRNIAPLGFERPYSCLWTTDSHVLSHTANAFLKMSAPFCCVRTKSASGDWKSFQHMGANEAAEEDSAPATSEGGR